MSTLDVMLNDAAGALREAGFMCLTIDPAEGAVRMGMITVRVTHDDSYIVETEIGHDFAQGQTVVEARAIIMNRVDGLTDSSVEVGNPIVDQEVGRARVPLERKCTYLGAVVRWCQWWNETA